MRRPPRLEMLEAKALLAITVETLIDEVSDNGLISLREAIATAATTPGDDQIEFEANLVGTIPITLGELSVDDATGSVSIDGAGRITLDAGGISHVLDVAAESTVEIRGLTLTGGSGIDGGAISNAGTLSLVESTLSGSSASGDGGGIFNYGLLSLTDSMVSGNSSTSRGGAIFNQVGTTTLLRSTVVDNLSGAGGGGIFNDYGTLNLTGSTISGNTSGFEGGGIKSYSGVNMITGSTLTGNFTPFEGGGFYGDQGALTLTDSIVSGNTASFNSGGLKLYNIQSTVLRSTIRDNVAGFGGGGLSFDSGNHHLSESTIHGNVAGIHGGGIEVRDASVNLVNSTVSGNRANGQGGGITNSGEELTLTGVTVTANLTNANDDGNGQGGGIWTMDDSTTTTLFNTIISGNLAGLGANQAANDLGGKAPEPSSQGNLLGSSQSSLSSLDGTNQVGVIDPVLGPLQDNGGPTFTHAVLDGSPAIDQGLNARALDPSGQPLTMDQRGSSRIQDGDLDGITTVEVGAFEILAAIDLVVEGTDGDDQISLEEVFDASLGSNVVIVNLNGSEIDRRRVASIFSINVNLMEGNDAVDASTVSLGILVDGGDGDDSIVTGSGPDTIDGGRDGDTISGGAGNDSIRGLGGFDSLLGGEGDDTLTGANGDDTLEGGPGNDSLVGGGDEDSILGGEGDDFVNGDQRADLIAGGQGNDTLIGRGGDDTIFGGLGNDSIRGSNDRDSVVGGEGDDTVEGNNLRDTLSGGPGNDLIVGGQGEDSLSGGEGDDTLGGGKGRNQVEGGPGVDTFELVGGVVGQDHLLDRSPSGALRHRQIRGDGSSVTIDLIGDYGFGDLVVLMALGGNDTVSVDAGLVDVIGTLDGGDGTDTLDLPSPLSANWTTLSFEA